MDEQYTYKMQEMINSNTESVLLWKDSGWLNEIELIVLNALLAMGDD
jgi:hypothetical protein